ncbi:MAG: glycogen/starch/alpha-glucan family phosphorylase [Pseudomonadota bacterium]
MRLPVEPPAPEGADKLLARQLTHHLKYSCGSWAREPNERAVFQALALAVRDQLADRLFEAKQVRNKDAHRVVHLVSMEYMAGRLLNNNLLNLGLRGQAEHAVAELGLDLEDILAEEPDLCLGHGGLARWSSCFFDSLATTGIPACGYGINYEYGLFRQRISNGFQKEEPERWPLEGTPWRFWQAPEQILVPVFGQTKRLEGPAGNSNVVWLDWDVVIGVPSDILVSGYGGKTINRLRLYTAQSSPEFNRRIAGHEHYLRAIDDRIASEKISKVLYPHLADGAGLQLRLVQQYFLVSCAIQDVIRQHVREHRTVETLADHQAIHLNGFQTALAVVELLRVLIDEYGVGWDRAWRITHNICTTTCHALSRDGMEDWPASLVEKVLPRHAGILRRIENTFGSYISQRAPDAGRDLPGMLLVGRGRDDAREHVRPANLCFIGCHKVNAVSRAHAEIVEARIAPGFARLWPEKFCNITNGVTPRRWIAQANPRLRVLIDQCVGEGWLTDPDRLLELETYSEDTGVLERMSAVRHANKLSLSARFNRATGVDVREEGIFDVHAKPFHENRRQLLTLLHIVDRYLAFSEDGEVPGALRTYIFAGKAMPGDKTAGLLIKLTNGLAALVNNDPVVSELMQIVFVPDYKVSVAEQLVPAADVSEQLSAIGHEACGTGAMKFAMNGARVLGSWGGGNPEIFEAAGEGVMYPFGMTMDEARESDIAGAYDAWRMLEGAPVLKRVLRALSDGLVCPKEEQVFEPLQRTLLEAGDRYRIIHDFNAYCEEQARIEADFQAPLEWAQMSLRAVARCGAFSSDRAVNEYVDRMWRRTEPATSERQMELA